MKKILILTDQRGFMADSRLPNKFFVDINLMKEELVKKGFKVEVSSIHNLKFLSKFEGWYVVYPSSEDPGLFYKSYIEDILLGLRMNGAILLPDFNLFRAHHNKMFMEIYRKSLGNEYNTVKSFSFYGLNDFIKKSNLIKNYPIVIKTSEGSSSAGVYIARDRDEARKIVRKKSKIIYYSAIYDPYIKLKEIVKNDLMRLGIKKRELSKIPPREKMIAQTFIGNLRCDYKVLVFGTKYYVLRRKVRDNDFRASGSGKFEYPLDLDDELVSILNYTKELYGKLNVPLLSADIAYDGEFCYLIEFQCVNFGPYTLEFSDHYYEYINDDWRIINGKSSLEKEMVEAYIKYIER